MDDDFPMELGVAYFQTNPCSVNLFQVSSESTSCSWGSWRTRASPQTDSHRAGVSMEDNVSMTCQERKSAIFCNHKENLGIQL